MGLVFSKGWVGMTCFTHVKLPTFSINCVKSRVLAVGVLIDNIRNFKH